MGLQQTVQRAYTGGFAGQLSADGPRRAKPARISSATVGVDTNKSTNHMSRAFGWSGEMPGGAGQAPVGVGYVATVAVGAGPFFGILGQPTSYALFGSAGNSLSPSMDLPIGSIGEFFDMATGLIVELFNDTTAIKASAFGDQVAYCNAAGDANGVPLGGLIGVAAGAAAPAGYALIPNARIMRPLTVPASAAGAAQFALTVIQLTE